MAPAALEARLSFMHVGGLVDDLDVAMAEYSFLATAPWAVSDVLALATYDGEHRSIVEQHVRIAYGRLPGASAIELIEPLATSPDSPQARLMQRHPGITHHAYWCDDVPGAITELAARGARLFSAAVTDRDAWAERLEADGEPGLVPLIDACYLELATGALIELVAESMLDGPLQRLLSPEITTVLPPPRVDR